MLNSVELVPNNYEVYVAHNRHQAKLNRLRKKHLAKDEAQAAYHHELLKWAAAVQRLLASYSNEEPNRILKYSDHGGVFKYREIDFISKSSTDSLIFTEIKLKRAYNDTDSATYSG